MGVAAIMGAPVRLGVPARMYSVVPVIHSGAAREGDGVADIEVGGRRIEGACRKLERRGIGASARDAGKEGWCGQGVGVASRRCNGQCRESQNTSRG